MGWLEKLNQLKKESGMTTDDIVAASGLPKGTLNKIFAGATKDPQLSTVRAIVHCLGHTLDDLDDSSENACSKKSEPRFSLLEIELVKKYRALDERGKKMVDLVLNEEYEQSQKPVHILQAVARGGAFLEKELTDEQVDNVDRLLEEIPPEYDDKI